MTVDDLSLPVRTFLDDQVARSRARILSEESMTYAVILLGDALVDWMGPGGDESFLILYLLAGGSLSDLVGGFCIDMALGGISEEADRRRHLTLWAREFLEALPPPTRSISSYPGYVRSQGNVPLPANDPVLFQIAQEAFASTDPALILLSEQLLIAQRSVSLLVERPSGDRYVLSAEPAPGYRQMLMGELAQPWEVLPPPYGPYVPARRL